MTITALTVLAFPGIGVLSIPDPLKAACTPSIIGRIARAARACQQGDSRPFRQLTSNPKPRPRPERPAFMRQAPWGLRVPADALNPTRRPLVGVKPHREGTREGVSCRA